MPVGSTFRQTSCSTQTCPNRRSVWKKVFCTFTCCGRRTYYGEDIGSVADEYTATNVQPMKRRLPYLGPIPDPSHLTASRKTKASSSQLLSFLREDGGVIRAMSSTESSSIVDGNQPIDIEFSAAPSTYNTTKMADSKSRHIQATVRNVHLVSRSHNDVTSQLHDLRPVQCQEKLLLLRPTTISRNRSPNVPSFPTYHNHLTHDVHAIFKPSQNLHLISSCTSFSSSSHRSKVVPNYHSSCGTSNADLKVVNFSNILKSTKNGHFMFSRDVLIDQASSSALSLIDHKECISTTPVNMKAAFSCELLSVTIPSYEGNFTRCRSAQTRLYFSKFSISTRQSCTSVFIFSTTWSGTETAPNRHSLPSTMCITKPIPMVYKSLSAPVDAPAVNVPSSGCDINSRSLVDKAPSCVLSIGDAPLFYGNVRTISPIRSRVWDPAAMEIRVNQETNADRERVFVLPPSKDDNLKHTDQQKAHRHQFSKKVRHSSEIHVVHTKSVSKRPEDTTSPDTGCKERRSRTPHSDLPMTNPTPGRNSTIRRVTPTGNGCVFKQPMIPSNSVVTTDGATGKNKTKSRKAVIDNYNVPLPLLGQSLIVAWNFVTDWWYSDLICQCASHNANAGQPIIRPFQSPWQLIAPIPFKKKLLTAGMVFSSGHAHTNNAAIFPRQLHRNPFQNHRAVLWNIQDHAMQSTLSKPLAPSDGNLTSICKVIPEEDLEGVCDRVNMPIILGRGCFGEVRLMKQLSSGRLCAVKVHHKERDEKKIIKDLHREVSALTSLDELDWVPKLFGISRIGKDSDLPVLVQEFVGDLTTFSCTTVYDVICSNGINGPSSFSVAIQLCRAMRDIHHIGILHCDLKPDNIMFTKGSSGEDGDVCIKIIDFGKAVSRTGQPKYVSCPRDKLADFLNKCVHIAPEVVKGLKPYSLQTEVYSVGLILRKIDVSPEKFLRKLGKKCLTEDWNQRPTIEELIHDIDFHIKGRQAISSQWAKVG